jgi:hypothetical protein
VAFVARTLFAGALSAGSLLAGRGRPGSLFVSSSASIGPEIRPVKVVATHTSSQWL